MMLVDKGYFDFDYEPIPPKPLTAEETMMSEDELHEISSLFGFGQPQTADELQAFAMKEEERKH